VLETVFKILPIDIIMSIGKILKIVSSTCALGHETHNSILLLTACSYRGALADPDSGFSVQDLPV